MKNLYKTNQVKLDLKSKIKKAIEKDIAIAKKENKFYQLTITCKYLQAKNKKSIVIYNKKASLLENFIASMKNNLLLDYLKSENKQKSIKITKILSSENLIIRIEKIKGLRKKLDLIEKYKQNQKNITLQAIKLYNISKNNSYCLNYKQYKEKQAIISKHQAIKKLESLLSK